MSDLYDEDIVLWSERQAALLRRHAATVRTNDAIDWPNIIEEIESVGNEQRHAVESLLLQAFIHRLKAEGWPTAGAVPDWQAEARVSSPRARRRFVPSMRQRIDLVGIYSEYMRTLCAACRIPSTVSRRRRCLMSARGRWMRCSPTTERVVMGDLYDEDIVLWSERQAALPGRVAAGEAINDRVDWMNVIDEVETADRRNGWKTSIRRAPTDVERSLTDSPSLRRAVAGMVADETVSARRLVASALEDLASGQWLMSAA